MMHCTANTADTMLITAPDALSAYYAAHRVWQGIPGIARTPKGRTLITFYSGGTAERFGNYALLFAANEGQAFGEPIAVVKKDGDFRVFDPGLWIDPKGRLWLFWNVMPGEEVWGAVCQDPDADTLVFEKERLIGRGVMMNKPTVLSSGAWLFPIALWEKSIYSEYRAAGLRPDDVSAAFVYRSTDEGEHFECLGGVDDPERSFDEHMLLETDDGAIRMLIRRRDGIGEAFSYDGGLTFTEAQDSGLGGPCSRFFISRLPSGRVLLVNHVDYRGRNNLTALLSEDGGRTFPYRLLLDGRRSVSYPDAAVDADGRIHIVYDRERGCFKSSLAEAEADAREILIATVTEADILNGSLTTEGSALALIASKLGHLAAEDGDPYESNKE